MDIDAGSWVYVYNSGSLRRFSFDGFYFPRETRRLVLIGETGGVGKGMGQRNAQVLPGSTDGLGSFRPEVPSAWTFAFLWPHSFVWMQAWYTVKMHVTKSRSFSHQYKVVRKEEGT